MPELRLFAKRQTAVIMELSGGEEERNIFRVDVACDKDKDYEGTARAAPCDLPAKVTRHASEVDCEGGKDIRYKLRGCYGKGEECASAQKATRPAVICPMEAVMVFVAHVHAEMAKDQEQDCSERKLNQLH
ncbi:hypothetical protein AK812_SmicGene19220 [Symbiodinium microadriaticum]|uniref:Uncharacterized protein n=1 Tax=Symbiodinium microadriaticum TaxID=2951 RepID=A0A1Q9DT83_SYMMI|nr:hypothetical protein AK812_SmicGene19220 [Symbiodinium microadriaticum]